MTIVDGIIIFFVILVLRNVLYAEVDGNDSSTSLVETKRRRCVNIIIFYHNVKLSLALTYYGNDRNKW